MQYLGNATIYCYSHERSSHLAFDLRLQETCGELWLEIFVGRDGNYSESSHGFLGKCLVRLKLGESVETMLLAARGVLQQVHAPQPAPRDDGALADVLRHVLDFQKRDGLWVPKFKPGDVVILDRPGQPEIRVLDADDGSFERVPKQPTELSSTKTCTCPARDLLTKGCSCGGKRLPAGLRELNPS